MNAIRTIHISVILCSNMISNIVRVSFVDSGNSHLVFEHDAAVVRAEAGEIDVRRCDVPNGLGVLHLHSRNNSSGPTFVHFLFASIEYQIFVLNILLFFREVEPHNEQHRYLPTRRCESKRRSFCITMQRSSHSVTGTAGAATSSSNRGGQGPNSSSAVTSVDPSFDHPPPYFMITSKLAEALSNRRHDSLIPARGVRCTLCPLPNPGEVLQSSSG